MQSDVSLPFPIVTLHILRVKFNAVTGVVERNARILHPEVSQRPVTIVDCFSFCGYLAEDSFSVPLDSVFVFEICSWCVRIDFYLPFLVTYL